MEACNDGPHNKLLEEVSEIAHSIKTLEDKLQEANNKHRQEVAEMEVKLRKMESTKEQISGERATLLEMNTALSGQVSQL